VRVFPNNDCQAVDIGPFPTPAASTVRGIITARKILQPKVILGPIQPGMPSTFLNGYRFGSVLSGGAFATQASALSGLRVLRLLDLTNSDRFATRGLSGQGLLAHSRQIKGPQHSPEEKP
jgi:hypothetical protein